MKTFRLIGMALVAVMMCVNFSGCSKDDDGTPEDPTIVTSKGKRLKKIEGDYYGYEDNDYIIFNYDEKGRLKSSTSHFEHTCDDDQKFTWSNDKIVSYESSNYGTGIGNDMLTHSLKDGKIVLIRDQYDAIDHSGNFLTYKDGKLYTYGYEDNSSVKFTVKWDGDKIASRINYNLEYGNYTFVYSGKTKGFNPLWIRHLFIDWWDSEFPLLIAHPELCGLDKAKDLITEIIDTESGAVLNRYTYELDKDGYITKITVYRNDSTYDYSLDLTWE